MPFKDPEKQKEYQRKYQPRYYKEYIKRPGVKERKAGACLKHYAMKPWAKNLKNARSRCNRKGSWYFKQGIKCFLTLQETEFLWNRDKAYLMDKPSIDRLNGGHYTRDNCRFIELTENKSRDKWRG